MKLEGIKKVITHDNCADGLVAAIICKRELPDAEIEFCQYGTDRHRTMAPVPGVLFIDFTPHPDTAQAWADAGACVLDHHEHAKDIVALFGDRGLFDNNRSGALLAFDEVLDADDSQLEELAELADIRDRWQKQSPRWNVAQSLNRVLMSVHRDEWLCGALPTSEMLVYGEMMARKEVQSARDIVEHDMETRQIGKLKVGVCSAAVSLSSAIGDAGREAGYDLTSVFFHTRDPDSGEKSVVYSMRSSERFDCGAFAKSMGGGGHAKAAGFSTQSAPHDPWEFFIDLAWRAIET